MSASSWIEPPRNGLASERVRNAEVDRGAGTVLIGYPVALLLQIVVVEHVLERDLTRERCVVDRERREPDGIELVARLLLDVRQHVHAGRDDVGADAVVQQPPDAPGGV